MPKYSVSYLKVNGKIQIGWFNRFNLVLLNYIMLYKNGKVLGKKLEKAAAV
jgi:hypothetical protein